MTVAHVRRRTVGWLLVGAGAVPALIWLLGIAPAQTVLLAAVGAGAVAVARFRPGRIDVTWPPPATLNPDKGTRREVARLSWSVGSGTDSQVGWSSVHRLQELARRRLARLDVRLGDPADADRGVALVGARPWQVLSAGRGTLRVSPGTFREAVLAVERLTPPATSAGAHRRADRGDR